MLGQFLQYFTGVRFLLLKMAAQDCEQKLLMVLDAEFLFLISILQFAHTHALVLINVLYAPWHFLEQNNRFIVPLNDRYASEFDI
jgi:hypothetical protein